MSTRSKARARVQRILRIARDEKLQEVADRIPCDVATLSRKERGLVATDEDFDLRLFAVLGGAQSIRRLIGLLQDTLDWIELVTRQNHPVRLA